MCAEILDKISRKRCNIQENTKCVLRVLQFCIFARECVGQMGEKIKLQTNLYSGIPEMWDHYY